ncbi:NUDIX hydrolase [Emticicia oligotrophica DSM 17448]|uniref:NUDIX hydrolase n=1 Tax=Emticicia oligotrophica (strain DSM 17448 / CIP 109782 / MTCC 6937 / GPTSA100-15) TaxID=929562 RepID=A0ABN4ADE1_EMTOG|nr:NUDIX hydrolase [Emticicia oligotrophica]AFK01501.1 NUDIX hydrolase [Emticicia oligotrophica DSM 17448]
MVIFIDDKLIRIVSNSKLKRLHGNDYDVMLDARLEMLNLKKLHGHVVILNANEATIDKFFKIIQQTKEVGYQSVTFVVDNKESTERQIRGFYKVVKAAGGVVFNEDDKILMMFRLGKWDLPKGKRDDGEKSKQTAVREVEEECGIQVKLGEKICTTWHTYTMGNNKILKRTKWYRMHCSDDSKMQPQTEEGIERLEWMGSKEVQKALLNSYSSIRFVVDQLGNKNETDSE